MGLPLVSHGSPMGLQWVSHGVPRAPMGTHGHKLVLMGLSWAPVGLQWAFIGVHGSPIDVHLSPVSSHGRQWETHGLQCVSLGSTLAPVIFQRLYMHPRGHSWASMDSHGSPLGVHACP